MSKIKNFFGRLFPTKRKLIQLYAALLYNAQLSGFITGNIYTGPLKHVCVPGMNCYSCPGAIGACPLGSIQNELAASKTKAPTYVLGIILLYCIMFGRWICGWICPGGWLQELLYKIKTPKLRKNRVTRVLSYFKYVLLLVLVIAVPVMFGWTSDKTVPGFCKYVCPIGTFEGAIFLLGNDANISFFDMLGPLFTWKMCLLVGFIVGSIFIYRFFCRFFCPLGALYGLFNKLSIIGIKVDKSKCNNCGACVSKCKMDVKQVGDHECIQCGECIDVCKQCAIKWKIVGERIKKEVSSTENEVQETNEVLLENDSLAQEVAPKKKANKKKVLQIITGAIMTIVLVTVIVISNINWTKHINVNEKLGDFKVSLYEEYNNGNSSYNIKVDNNLAIIYFYDEYQEEQMNQFIELKKSIYGTFDMIAISSYSKKDVNKEHLKNASDNGVILGYDDKSSSKITLFNEEKTYPYYAWVSNSNILSYSSSSFFDVNEINLINISLLGGVVGNSTGNVCFRKDLTTFDKSTLKDNGTFNLMNNEGKITILNFWFTECGPCVSEIPEFDKVAKKYSDSVELVLVHCGSMFFDYVKDGKLKNLLETNPNFQNLSATFAYDDENDSYYKMLGGRGAYPITIVVDQKGFVIKNHQGSLTEAELEAIILPALNNK